MKLIEIYEGTIIECQMLKDLLENECITTFLSDEINGTRGGLGWRPAGGVKVLIADENLEKANEILHNFKR